MSSTPDSFSPEADDQTSGSGRRIPIGTQRPGSKPPSLSPKYEYVAPPEPAPAREAAAAEAATTDEIQPPARGGGNDRGGRGRRRERDSKPSFTDGLPPTKRVAVPSIRGGLDDELEADFEAAIAGVEVDALLAAGVGAKIDAPLEPGARVQGTVLSVGGDTAFIDLGGNRQGALKLAPLVDAGLDLPTVGALIDVSIGGRNADDDLYDVAPANRAVAIEDWSQLQAGMVVEARVTGANKGGLECEVAGLRGFMPASLVSPWRVENLEEMVGQTLESLVTDIVPAARRLVLSRRAVVERQASDARAKMLETLEVGDALDGIVRSVRDFGAFVDVGNGVEGLVHVSQLSWERVANPADVLQPGQRVRVIVKKIDRQTGKISLSARDLVESPWKRAAEKYHVGATVRGTVSRIAQFGAFVKLEPGVEGLVHVSELAHRHVRSVSDVVREGAQVECRVLACDPGEQRLSLSIKALAAQSATAPADEEAEPPSAVSPPAVRKHSGPLKGGVGGTSDGARFGLKW